MKKNKVIVRITKDGKAIPISKIPPGSVRVHLYNFKNVLRPRGSSMDKESLSLDIYEELKSAFESWTDPVYGDNPARTKLIDQLRTNLDSEVKAAWTAFLEEIMKQGR